MGKYTVWTDERNSQRFMQEFVDKFGDMCVTITMLDEDDVSLGIVCPYCAEMPYPEHISLECCANCEDRKEYTVEYEAVYTMHTTVEASSREEAIAKVKNGEGDDSERDVCTRSYKVIEEVWV